MTGTRDIYAKPMKALTAIKKMAARAANNDDRTVLLRHAIDEW